MITDSARNLSHADWGPGAIASALEASLEGRVLNWIRDADSEPLALFSPQQRALSTAGDWYGEHVGKWLATAALAHRRTQCPQLAAQIGTTIQALRSWQEPSGYLGTYAQAATCRFTHPDASMGRTWDLWVHAWLIKGLLAVGSPDAVEIAARIGSLLIDTFGDGSRSVLDLGNHGGLSSAVLVEPLARLTEATGDPRYADLAARILEQMEERGIGVLSGPHRGQDVSDLATGKSYQLLWILVGMLALDEVRPDPRLEAAVRYWWSNIEERHLTPAGGPWGGIGTHKEVFNAANFFSPRGMVETCSTATWMSLCRMLYERTNASRYIEAFERSLLNALLGAMDANGRDWCYFTFPNGHRHNTYHWACCKASGALALEEAGLILRGSSEHRIPFHLLQACRLESFGNAVVAVGDPATGGDFLIEVEHAPSLTEIAVRIPSWAQLRSVHVNGERLATTTDPILTVKRHWQEGDQLRLEFHTPVVVHPFTHCVDHHGQEIVREDYACVTRGPYVYATGLFKGYKEEETQLLPRLNPASWVSEQVDGTLHVYRPGRDPVVLEPFYRAGGRTDGAWRRTWIQVAWQ